MEAHLAPLRRSAVGNILSLDDQSIYESNQLPEILHVGFGARRAVRVKRTPARALGGGDCGAHEVA